MSEVAIKVEGVSKDFKLTHERGATLKSHFVSLLKGKKTKSVEVQHALKDVSFEIKKGEFFGIVGRNGSGKSTLLKMLAGIYQPTKGKIHTQGKLVPFIELGVGFNPELTGRENVFLNGALLGFSEEEVTSFYDEVVEFAELEQFMDKKLKNYSSGMQVRLAFAMAVRAQADILLIDEVLAVGDADFQRKCFEYFRQLKKQEVTVVFVSHDMSAVREYCNKSVLVEDGSIIKSGSSNKIADEYSKLFIDNSSSTSGSLESRYGSGEVLVKKTKIIPTVSEKNTKILIDFEVRAKQDVENIVVGFRCKNAAGEPIFGSNTTIEGKKISKINRGEAKRLLFHLPNIFNNGSYTIDLNIENADGAVYDWIIDAIRFDVKTEKKTGYIVEIPVEVEIKDAK